MYNNNINGESVPNKTDIVNETVIQQQSNEEQIPEVWSESVNGKELYQDLVRCFNQYLALQEFQAEALALWSIFSYCIEANNIAPKLLITSPEKRCGKTTLLDVLAGVTWKPLSASNVTPAVIYRVIEHIGGTLILDEADTFIKNNPELNGIINSGHRKSQAFVLRCDGDQHIPKKFSTWTPCVIAMIGKPTDTLVDRSITIEMKRKTSAEHVDRFSPIRCEEYFKKISSKIARWAEDNIEALKYSEPSMPSELNDRAGDNWRPLFAISDLLGENIKARSRVVAVELSKPQDTEENSSVGVKLLSNIHDMLMATSDSKITTQSILLYLHAIDDGPWAEWNRGRELTAAQLAKHLKPFNIRSKKLRIGSSTLNGYERFDFEDAFLRYLDGTCSTSVPDTMPPNRLNNNDCSSVPSMMVERPKATSIFDD